MNDSALRGTIGETMACNYLERLGYHVVERNWKYGRYEIDILAWYDNVLIVIEVKTRADGYYRPEHYVTRNQWYNIAFATGRYMDVIGYEWEVRFDIVAITIQKRGSRVTHFKDVFFPGRF